MGKNLMIAMLKSQLEVANATISSLTEEMQAMRQSFETTISELRKTIANLESLLQERNSNLDAAKNQLRAIRATAFPKSEKQRIEPSPTTEEKASEKERRSAAIKARGNNGARRKERFELKTIEEDVYPDSIDRTQCTEIGVRDVVRYEMVPLSFIKHVYHIHTLKSGDTIHSCKAPVSPLLNSNFDGSFIAGIAELRYLFSMPVERIVKYFQCHGFEIDKPTAHNLISKAAGLLENLYKAMGLAVKESAYLCCDETYHTVLVEGAGRGSKKGYIWAIVSVNNGLTYFFYDDGSRSQDVILNKLKDYTGVIQSDGLRAYKNLAEQSGGRIKRAACLQHCKRPFVSDDLKDNPDARTITELTNRLYRKEHEHGIGEGWSVEDNRLWRRQYAPPILRELKSELERIKSSSEKYPPKSLMARSVNYFLNEWDGIEAIFSTGDVALDNNLIERTNRYISLSRHNSLFFGSHAGASRGCVFYSLACSCRLLKINFFEYLSDILNKTASMPNGTPPEAYRGLLPDRWTKE